MKIKTMELTGAALDWAAAKCEGLKFTICENFVLVHGSNGMKDGFNPSSNWSQGGPIIEREWLHITPWPNESDEDLRWQCKQHDSIDCVAFGPTPLIAAMRCYVASQLGDEVDVPEGLV